MGGFVEVNESGEEATLRELEEETGIALSREEANPTFFGLYSDPRRDNRRPTASIIYVLDIPLSYKPRAGDDAKGVKRVALSDIGQLDFFADHLSILLDYRESILVKQRVPVDSLPRNKRGPMHLNQNVQLIQLLSEKATGQGWGEMTLAMNAFFFY